MSLWRTIIYLLISVIPVYLIFADSGEVKNEPITDNVYLFWYSAPRTLEIPREWYEIEVITTAYNSLEAQTDSTPFITASGQRTRDGIVACNCLPFGTIIEIDGKEYEVQDRLNSRYTCSGLWRIDIWLEYYQDAIKYGKQIKTIRIYK